MTATEIDPIKFYDGLVGAGLIIPTGVDGVFARSEVFEDVVARFDAAVNRIARSDGAVGITFPPTIDRQLLQKVGYMDNFPNLSGFVYSFFGKELEARQLAEKVTAGQPFGDHLKMTDVTLCPAACYPVYPTLAGRLPEGGKLVTICSWVFRHEPSKEPTRMQAFRMREYIRAGSPEDVVRWRDMWVERGVALLQSLGLPANPDVANDPFFGRGGKMLAASQREQKLKFEILVPVISVEKPTAVCSFNYHEGKFGDAFGIQQADGTAAQTACLGFGLERCTMALFQTHGFDPKAWPANVRAILWS